VPADCGRARHPSAAAALGAPVARREVRPALGPACTAFADSNGTDHPERTRREESLRPDFRPRSTSARSTAAVVRHGGCDSVDGLTRTRAV